MKGNEVDRREIEDVIVGLLAETAGTDADALRMELEDLGEWLPIDSLLAAEVLARVEEIYGVTFPATSEASANLRSVTAFAQAILELFEAREAATADTA